MNNEDRTNPVEADNDGETKGVDEVITPTSPQTLEQEAEALRRKIAEIERKVADGN
ncbi:hypothetical protein [Pseudomonas sp. PD9R]|uniref:hypothetical protein n=1 Tax=Pseudomonas sp. PD9R TaxID=2853534 RepID=UPI001C4883DA|nr:hypothetical protein [Pseudomonas sp. PD9R]MBV6821992.1 hypothetical protein [Pseudomonas sp. PD9R]